jgi:hypothetical protein
MDPRDVIFVGGGWPRLISVRIRCVDIAEYLGCDFRVNVASAGEIPAQYKAFICVKTRLNEIELTRLAKRGPIIWDIIDRPPPPVPCIGTFIASTKGVRDTFSSRGRIEIIHHYHCNFEADPNLLSGRHPAWIGLPHWLPQLDGFEYDVYDVSCMNRETVASAYRKTGIGLNLRAQKEDTDFHAAISSGIKLINCIGFAIPSISGPEPSYTELGRDCTLFSPNNDCSNLVHLLQNDDALYMQLRQNCIAAAPQFHIATIANKYRALIDSL